MLTSVSGLSRQSAREFDDDEHQHDDEEQVDERSSDRDGESSEEPEDKQDEDDGPEHRADSNAVFPLTPDAN